MTAAPFAIDGHLIDRNSPPFVIAEVSANHRGDLRAALDIVAAAADSGADAVKFQHYTATSLTVRSNRPEFTVGGGTLWDGRQLVDLYAEAQMPWEWTDALVAEAQRRGLTWLSSPFDAAAVEFLDQRGAPALKIASFELVDLPLIRAAASTGRPLLMSTGMATMEEIDAAVAAAHSTPSLALLRCNSAYPAPTSAMDLSAIPVMRERWPVQVGLSDHTRGETAAIAAVALGASIIEKHLTLRRDDGGPDAAFSAEPDELADLVVAVREAHTSLGTSRFGPSDAELGSLAFRRSLRAVREIAAGAIITSADVASIRPSGGLPPDAIDHVVGSVARVSLDVGAPILAEDVEPPVPTHLL